MNSVALRRSDGRVFKLFRVVGKSKQRFGYATQFFERSELLQVIYKRLPDKLSLLLSRGVVDIVSKPNGASIITDKGEVNHADIIVGADGVRSLTRRTIWDNLGRDEPQGVANDGAGKS
jgi:salicylate hydroxylase